MAIQPVSQAHLLTVAEYLEIGEVEPGYTELVEGRLLVSPSPAMRHNRVSKRLAFLLDAQLAPAHETIQDIDLDLQLDPSDAPGTVRRPDLVVVSSAVVSRVEEKGGVLRASDVALVIEVLSPGSRRIDHVAKRSEYADAGIGHYWIIDIEPPVSLLACHLAGAFGYADGGPVTGRFVTAAPLPVTIDLDALLG